MDPPDLSSLRLSEQQELESARHQREVDNQDSPFLKLPGELRNKIYDYALPHDEILSTGNIRKLLIEEGKEESIQRCVPIQHQTAYKYHFGLTQACRLLRKETLKISYSANTFILRVWVRKYGSRHPNEIGDAEDWVNSRQVEAMQGLSRVILQHWDPIDSMFRGQEMVLFEPSLKTAKLISDAEIDTCDTYHEGRRSSKYECYRCYENKGRVRNFDRLLRDTVKSTQAMEKPGDKLLELVARFRERMPARCHGYIGRY